MSELSSSCRCRFGSAVAVFSPSLLRSTVVDGFSLLSVSLSYASLWRHPTLLTVAGVSRKIGWVLVDYVLRNCTGLASIHHRKKTIPVNEGLLQGTIRRTNRNQSMEGSKVA